MLACAEQLTRNKGGHALVVELLGILVHGTETAGCWGGIMCMAWLSSLPHLSSCRWARCWQQGSAGSLLLPLGVCLQPRAVKRCCAELLDVMGTQQTKLLLPFSQEVLLVSLKSRGRCPVNSRPFCRRAWCLQAAVLLAAAQCPALPTQTSQVGCFTTNLEERENVFLSISYMLSVQL